MNLSLLLVFLLPILSGGLLVHLLWPDRGFGHLVYKASLGTGIGLGISSLLYFIYLMLFAGRHLFIFVQLAALGVLLAAVILVEKKRDSGIHARIGFPRLAPAQWLFVMAGCAVLLLSLLTTAGYLLRRRQGDWDAWMMYNRAARFVYRDQAHWLQSFSPKMDPIFHADYPLLLAMNIASGWDALGTDSPRVPMVESAAFAVACVGLLVSALAAEKAPGQAALGLLILWGTPVFVNEGARQMADVPLAFYVLATGTLIYLFVVERKPRLIVLAGLSAGLAAWTKNEGSLFVIAVLIALALAFSRERWRILLWYAAGLALPLAIVLYFKLALAPPSDVLSSGLSRSLHQLLDLSRHAEILRYFWAEITGFGAWGIASLSTGIVVILAIYYLLFRAPIPYGLRPAYIAGIVILAVQACGYYGIYLITPYELAWHLSYSTTRIVLQVFPLLVFLVLSASVTPETVFAPMNMNLQGGKNAACN